MDLSSPSSKSANDGIPSDLCTLHYSRIDDAVDKVRDLVRGTLLVKMDLMNAYRIVPVHLDDYHLLGISWEGHT